MLKALEAHARAVHLREAVTVVDLHVEEGLYTPSECVRVGFGTNHGYAQREVRRILAHLAQPLAQDERVGGQYVRHCGVEVLHKLYLAGSVACACGNGHAAQALCACVYAKAACEQAIAGHVLEHVLAAHAHHVQAAGHEIRPGVQIVLRVGNGHGRAGCAA